MFTAISHTPAGDSRRAGLDKRLDDIGWALLLITVGTLWLVPDDRVPHGAWVTAFGVLLLALNGIRYASGIRIRAFSAVVGALALAAGLSALAGVEFPLFAIALIVAGVGIILKPLLARRT